MSVGVFLTQPRLDHHRDGTSDWRGRVPGPSQRVLHAGFLIDRWRSRCVGLLPIESHNSIKPLILVGLPILSLYYVVLTVLSTLIVSVGTGVPGGEPVKRLLGLLDYSYPCSPGVPT